jgi:DNA polymerase III epsilon subunit-like protein
MSKRIANVLPLGMAAIDLETTGLNHGKNHVIQLGLAVINIFGECGSGMVYCKLPKSETVPEFITELTGITDEILEEEGQPVQEIMDEMRTYAEMGTIFVIHNATFDLGFLARYGVYPKSFFCTRSIEAHFTNESISLKPTAERYGIDIGKHHDAEHDAVTAMDILNAQMGRLNDPHKFNDLRNLMVYTDDRPLQYVPYYAKTLHRSEVKVFDI